METITDGQTLTCPADKSNGSLDNALAWINQMIGMARDDADIQLEETMKKFESFRYMSRKLFKIIQ